MSTSGIDGLFSSDSLVPLAGATRRGSDEIVIAATKNTVKDAPHLDTDGELSEQAERELYAHYGVSAPAPASNTRTSEGADSTSHAGPKHAAADADAARRGAPIDRADSDAIVRHEERLYVGTDRVATGTARLRKHAVTETQTVTVPTREEVRVVREPITDATAVSDTAIGDTEREVTLHEDRVTVNKETVPVEKVRLDVDTVGDEQTVSDTVRKERIDTGGADPRGVDSGRSH